MSLNDAELGKILVEQSYLNVQEFEKAEEQALEREVPLKTVLLEQGLLSQELFESALAEYYKLPFFNVKETLPTPQLASMLPEEIARTYSSVVVGRPAQDQIYIATADPGNPLLDEALRLNIDQQTPEYPEAEDASKKKKKDKDKTANHFSFAGREKKVDRKKYEGTIQLIYAPKTTVDSLFVHYRKPLATRFQAIIDQQKKVAPEIIEEIFNDAIELRASDIHFEPQEHIVIVRFRVDGVMHEAGRIPREYYEGVVNRIKIAGNMKIDEHFAAQDGAIRYETPSGGTMDIRVSIVPIVDGEKIVLRLLSEYVRTLTLADLGFSEEFRQVLERAAHKPFGMILTTGPTGSGKSTTLYALLKMRNHPDVNISTIEDPVEYKIPGINHIQVNADTELTFAKGLRALVRQDPNIILVGEIRDGETASIAVNAALTGHLLFSTLHSNDAATAVPRLLEMGVEPFLLASTLEVIIGQRLIRRICSQCRFSYSLAAADAHKLFPGAEDYFPGKDTVRLYRGKGCESCGGTGYRSRIGIYELLVVTPEMEQLITARASTTELNNLGRKQGLKLLFDDGFDKVKAGMTTIEELLRVAAPPEILFANRGQKK
ncbi:MAG: ral secretory pathway protein type pilus assembly protein PilB [Candidatus Peribacteria bacterium]|nr:ral secretory pathway protein type pilus assembly protein PilB [Candidatus Peribacteria bacterium]